MMSVLFHSPSKLYLRALKRGQQLISRHQHKNAVPNFWALGDVTGSGSVPIESPPTSQYLSIQIFAPSAAIWLEFQCQIMTPTIWPPQILDPWSNTHSYSTSIHTIGKSCTVWPQYMTRQATDRATGIWSLCFSIGGLKIECTCPFGHFGKEKSWPIHLTRYSNTWRVRSRFQVAHQCLKVIWKHFRFFAIFAKFHEENWLRAH